MAEYYLNNKPLSDFGIVPSRSNRHIALSGCFDLPKRIGDTYFDWPRENGVDQYVHQIIKKKNIELAEELQALQTQVMHEAAEQVYYRES